VFTPDISQALDEDQRLCQQFLVMELVLHHIGEEGLFSNDPGGCKEQPFSKPRSSLLARPVVIGQGVMALNLGRVDID